ncbi:MAG: hypothetical protein D8M61_21035, partial [Ignavibacteriae bacterium]|nr:hypothetical protein [Ignavibacteriota bacterium]
MTGFLKVGAPMDAEEAPQDVDQARAAGCPLVREGLFRALRSCEGANPLEFVAALYPHVSWPTSIPGRVSLNGKLAPILAVKRKPVGKPLTVAWGLPGPRPRGAREDPMRPPSYVTTCTSHPDFPTIPPNPHPQETSHARIPSL